jgi:hypothetical protein
VSKQNHESTKSAPTSDSKEKPSNLSAEILRLMREGGAEGRKKAQELMQEALSRPKGANR